MAHKSKKYREAKAKIDSTKQYEISEAIKLLKEAAYTKFNGSVEIAIKTNANPKYNDQMIRWTVVLPHGTGKKVRVAAFVSDEKKDEIKKAGADIVGNEELLTAIQAGKIDFDVLVTTPDMMRDLAPVAKALGPKGLMPSPKAGTVTSNMTATISDIKKGRVEFKLDKTWNIHSVVGKMDFENQQLQDNIQRFLAAVVEHRPNGVKGKLFKKAVISWTISPWIQLMVNQ